MSIVRPSAPDLRYLRSEYPQYKLLLIHPFSRYRSLLVMGLINRPPGLLYYYRVRDSHVGNLNGFLYGLIDALEEHAPATTTALDQALTSTPDDIPALAGALSTDLAREDSDYTLLIIDDADLVNGIADCQRFLATLVAALPAHCHLLIAGRTLPTFSWLPLVAAGEAIVLKNDDLLGSEYYAVSNAATHTLEAFAFGPGHIILDGHLITDWAGDLPRQMLFFSLDGPAVTREQYCEAFWPDFTLEQAVNVFHVTKRRLHLALGLDALVFDRRQGGYRLNPQITLRYDVLAFLDNMNAARQAEGAIAAAHWQQAANLYEGDYLQDGEYEWMAGRRAALRSGYAETLAALAEVRQASGDEKAAQGLSQWAAFYAT